MDGRRKGASIEGEPTSAGGAPQPTRFPTDIDCDECGKPMVARKGRRGWFLGCSGYPKCRNTGDVPAKLMEEMGLNGNGNGKTAEPTPMPPPLDQDHEDAA